MSTRTELPWSAISAEVHSATSRFMLHEYGEHKDYINIRLLAQYLYLNPDKEIAEAYPHLTDGSYRTVVNRLRTGMEKMGWVEYSRGVFRVSTTSYTTTTNTYNEGSCQRKPHPNQSGSNATSASMNGTVNPTSSW